MMDKKQYYTAGELAKLFRISKQTMLYYDKLGLLTPEFVAENGYRYYATQQYLTLEIILFLRKLDISVPDIKKFLEHRSKHAVDKLIADKAESLKEIIRKSQQELDSLEGYREYLRSSDFLMLDQIMLKSVKKTRMFVTPLPPEHHTGRAAINARAAHVHEVFANSCLKARPTGWVVPADEFFQGHFTNSSAIVTESGNPGSGLPCNFVRSAGLYMSIYVKGSYFERGKEIKDRFQKFLSQNHLQSAGDVFIFPVISYWSTNDPKDYINAITMKVTGKVRKSVRKR